jgi:2-keto-4-pentenoate hydratase/2-oxohepta-3-ene-1,7-dioic acid hydratase in catechol pathway
MKLAQISLNGTSRIGLLVPGGLVDVASHLPGIPIDMIELIKHWGKWQRYLASLSVAADYSLDEVRLEAPIRRPGKVLGIGLNYADHVAEAKDLSFESSGNQVWFFKAVTAINGPYDPIELPLASRQLDYEAELVVVIGKRCRSVPESEVGSVIFGYCVGNDLTLRDWQRRSGNSIGKSFDTTAPIGPCVVTPDETDARDCNLRTYVNGELRQESNTCHMIADVAAQIAYVSQAMTLEPGDLIFTGTPAGVGVAMHPPKFLVEGDTVRVEVDGIGALENRVELRRRTSAE